MGDPGRILAVLGTALAVAGCGATGPAGATRVVPPAAPAAPAAPRVVPAARSSALVPPPAVARPRLPEYGNPDGHAYVPPAGRAVSTAHPDHVIGHGSAASCTPAAVVRAVALGGVITFNCGPVPVTITMTATAKIVHGQRIVIDGGGKVTLSGGGKIRILAMDTCPGCWEQAGPHLIVQNISFADGYAGARQSSAAPDYGGGAILARGGQLAVVNSVFTGNRCYRYGPDLGGGAIRAYGMDMSTPVYITSDTFRDGRCANGGALSGLYANFVVINSLLTGNQAIGWGQNPAQAGTPGGGSGGAIYTDGDSYNLIVDGTVIRGNSAREGGGAIFCVVNNDHGTLTIRHSVLHHNPSGQFQNAPGIFDSLNGHDVQPVVIDSAIS
jgi:predicted outer membrane repeat protein